MARSMIFMKQQIASVYGPLFVSDMPPRQVAAIYNNMKARGKFDKKKGKQEDYHQMNIFDYIFEQKGERIELWEQIT